MTIEVELETDPDAWNTLVERAPHGTPFHLHEYLTVAARHADAELYPLVGYKGQEPVGLFPFYTRSMGPVSVGFSPPPNRKITYGGPVRLNFRKLKQRKAERRNRRFVEGCLEWIDETCDPWYVNVRACARYGDARPFIWESFDVTPGYTHVVDLTGEESALLDRFSRDARKNVADPDPDTEIREAGAAVVERIVEQVRRRHVEQGESYGVPTAFLTDLYRELPDGVMRPYACRVDGTFAGGMIALEFGDTIYRWQGGAKPDVDVPVNDLVDWQIMREARDRGIERYDLVGAGEPSISQYKAKFAPTVTPYFEMTRTTAATGLLRDVYRLVR